MPTALALKERGESLRKEITDTINATDMTAAEKTAKLSKIGEDVAAHETELKNHEHAVEMRAKLGTPSEEQHHEQRVAQQYAKSLGERIIENDAYKRGVAALGGQSGMGAKGNFRESFELKDSTAGANQMGEALDGATGPNPLGNGQLFLPGTAGQVIMPWFQPGITPLLFYPNRISSLIPSVTTDSPVYSWVKEASWTNNAAPTAEGGLYPYSSNELTRVEGQVGKITNALKVTDEMYRDAPQFFSFANERLRQGIERTEEVQILAGSGMPGVKGLYSYNAEFTEGAPGAAVTNVSFPTAGTPGAGASSAVVASITPGRTVAGTGATAGSDIADAVYHATVDIETGAFVVPDAYVFNPVDWSTVRLGKDSNGQYLGGSYFGTNYGNGANAGETLWGRPVIVTPAQPKGLVLVGAFRECSQIVRKDGISVEVTNSNGTDFDHGLISVRAEERLGLQVIRPAGFEIIQITG